MERECPYHPILAGTTRSWQQTTASYHSPIRGAEPDGVISVETSACRHPITISAILSYLGCFTCRRAAGLSQGVDTIKRRIINTWQFFMESPQYLVVSVRLLHMNCVEQKLTSIRMYGILQQSNGGNQMAKTSKSQGKKGRQAMAVLIEAPEVKMDTPIEIEALIVAMGKRLQAEYVSGAIPYLREHEPALWERLEVLDRQETIEALLEYERLFFEGLRRYVTCIEAKQQAA